MFLLKASTNENRTSNPQAIQIRISRTPDKAVDPPTPSMDCRPNKVASLVPTDESDVHAFVAMTSTT